MGLGVLRAMGVNMPFKEAVQVNDPESELAAAINDHTIPALGKVVRVTSHFLVTPSLESNSDEISIEKSKQSAREAWLGNRSRGGGLLLDLMPHITNMTNLIGNGLEIDKIETSVQSVNTGKPGEYKTICRENGNLTYIDDNGHEVQTVEDRAKVIGTMKNGAEFEFEVGRFATNNEHFLELEDENGRVLRVEYKHPYQTTLKGKDGELLGSATMEIDPYCLIAAHMMEHFTSDSKFPLFADVQLQTIRDIIRMDDIARSHLAEEKSAERSFSR